MPWRPGGTTRGWLSVAVPLAFGWGGAIIGTPAPGSATLISFSDVGSIDCRPGCSGIAIVAAMKSVKCVVLAVAVVVAFALAVAVAASPPLPASSSVGTSCQV